MCCADWNLNRLAAGCLRKQPAGGEGTGGWGLRKVSESTFNCALLFPFAVTSRHFRGVRINQRIDSLPCPALFSMFPGRLARFAQVLPRVPLARIHQIATIGLRRLNYVWIMGQRAAGGAGRKRHVVEYGWDLWGRVRVSARWL